MDSPIAVIDLGTNTFHLLIAAFQNGKFAITHRERSPVKIGLGGINQGVIQESGIFRAIDTLKFFKTTADQKGVKKIYAFGTSALRNAKNGPEVVQRIKESTSIEVAVISGEEEAAFIYQGVRSAVNLGADISLIMDIGGGSVECIIGNADTILWKQSFEIGAQRLLERFQKHDPITRDEIAQLDDYFNSSLPDLFQAIRTFQPSVVVGSSGTFDTLSEIHCIKQNIRYNEDDSETPLTIQSFHDTYQKLISKNRIERLRIPGMIEMRVDMIVTASCLIRFLLENFEFKAIRVSTYSLKEGVLAHLAKTKK